MSGNVMKQLSKPFIFTYRLNNELYLQIPSTLNFVTVAINYTVKTTSNLTIVSKIIRIRLFAFVYSYSFIRLFVCFRLIVSLRLFVSYRKQSFIRKLSFIRKHSFIRKLS